MIQPREFRARPSQFIQLMIARSCENRARAQNEVIGEAERRYFALVATYGERS